MKSDTPETPAEVFLVADFDASSRRLDAIVAAAVLTKAPTVLLRIADACPATVPELSKAVARIQESDVAVLIEDSASLAKEVSADGCHISWHEEPIDPYTEARETLGDDLIVGADAGRSRHNAMQLGEHDAAFVGFGIPARVTDRETARARQVELISWWNEIFEVPSVAFDVADAEHAAAVAVSGADFIALDLPADMTARGLADWWAPHEPAFALAARAA